MTTADEQRQATLRALADTVIPSIARDDDPDGFWARSATDLGVDVVAGEFIANLPDAQRIGLGMLLDALGGLGLATTDDQMAREQIVRGVAASSPEAGVGMSSLVSLIQFLHYGAPDPATGRNANWDVFGYPGPPGGAGVPGDVPKPIATLTPNGDTTLDADVCIVGSGAGGSVIAGRLAQEGHSVVVLEAGGYYTESDFTQYELQAYQDLYWRGGPAATADANVTMLSGTALGGGTIVNWTNCLRTPDWVRKEWATEHGLDGVDGPDFDAHLDAVLERVGANDQCSDYNDPHQRMVEGCEALGLRYKRIVRNAAPDGYSPDTAGFMGFGDRSGSKRSIDKTFLLDAFEAGRADPRALQGRPDHRDRRPRGRHPGNRHRRRRQPRLGDRQRTAGRRRVRRPGLARAAAALGYRRPRGRRLLSPAHLHVDVRDVRRRSEGVVGLAAGDAVPPLRQPGRRLRLHDRGLALLPRPDRLEHLARRRGAQGADDQVPQRRGVHLADPRPRPRPDHDR